MGITHIHSLLQSSTVSQQQIPWSTQFHLLDKQPLNNTYILHHLPTSVSYKIKHLTLNKLQHCQLFRQIDLRSTNPSPFVVKLDKIQQYTVKGYCSQHQEVFLMFKYVENTLKEEILNRRFKRERFTQDEIKVILQAGVKGIAYLHDIGCTPKALNTSQILITQQRAVLVNDPLLSIGSILSHTMQRSSNQTQNSQNIFSTPQQDYPSPQKLLFQNDLIEQYNEWLSELFTFGAIILEAIFLEPLGEVFYDKIQKKIYYHKVKEKVEEISEGMQLQKSNDLVNNGFSSASPYISGVNQQSLNQPLLLNQIKQDLRRLLSHQPRIRQSVYLKYKKNHSSYLFLNKAKEQTKQTFTNTNNQFNPLMNTQSQQFGPFGQSSNIQEAYKHKFQSNKHNYFAQIQKKTNPSLSQFSKFIQQSTLNNTNQPIQRKYQLDEFQFKNKSPNNRFRVVSSSLPHNNKSQSLNTKSSFVMPVTSQYIINNPQLGLSEIGMKNDNSTFKPAFHHLGKRTSNSPTKQNKLNQIEQTNPFHQSYNKYSNLVETINQPTLTHNYNSFDTNNNHHHSNYLRKAQLSPKKQLLVEKRPQTKLYYQTILNQYTIPTFTSNNQFHNIYQPQSYTSQIFTSKPYQHFNALESNFSTSPTLDFSRNNVTRSESSYVLQSGNRNANYTAKNYTNFNDNTFNNDQWTYDKMTSKKDLLDTQLTNQPTQQNLSDKLYNQPQKISLSHSYDNKFTTFTNNNNNNNNNYKQTTTYTPSPSLFPINSNTQSNYPLNTQQPNSNFINFEEWKKNHASSYLQDKSNLFTNNSNYSKLPKIPSSKQLSHFPFKQAGSINCDESHFLNDKQSFVIESYTGNLNKLNQPQRVQTPISTLNSSNLPNISPKNSFQINHSGISNFRNEGKSFSSMDQDLKQLRKFGQLRDYDKKPNSSYSSSQKVSVIDKIYDPEVINSYDRKYFDNSPPKKDSSRQYAELDANKRHSQNINNRPSNEKFTHNDRNSSQNYLQTPQRYPAKNRLNSTIRQASCQESGVNHSNSNNESYQNQKIYPNTQISKYQLLEDRRLSQRKVETKSPTVQELKIAEKQSVSKGDNNNNKSIDSQHRVTLYADGSRYIGQTDDQGQSHGYGILYYPDGQVAYQGSWLHGDFNGKGKLFNPYILQMAPTYNYKDLTRMDEHIKEFQGIFINDVKQGKGVLKMHNDQIYNGEFVQDLPHGRGKFYCSNGNVIEGIWEKGILKNIM